MLSFTVLRASLLSGLIAALAACGGGGGDNSAGGGGTTPTNTAPVARAGSSQSVLTGTSVSLDGSGSTDADNDSLTFSWVFAARPAGSIATLATANSSSATFVADVAGSYTASLVVSDGKVSSAAATVLVTAATPNSTPIARAGSNQSLTLGSTVQLDGTGSTDADGNSLTYSWTLSSRPAGSSAVLSTATASRPTFVADVAGTYTASLVVSDGAVNSQPSSVTVTASVANAPPIANAGSAQSVTTGSTVTLSGAASSDANGDPLTYAWTLSTRPVGSVAALANANSISPSFTADVVGTFVATLVVNDGAASSAPATATIAATQAINPLLAGAGTFAQEFPFGKFYSIDAGTGGLIALGDGCAGYSAADIRSDGQVLAVSGNATTVVNIDVVSGACRDFFAVSEPMIAIAVAADGTIITISSATSFGARQIYRYSSTGSLLGQAAASGISGVIGIGNFTSPGAIDFAPDGSLYATALGTVWLVNPVTGVGTLKAVGLNTVGDIDIDSSGTLWTISFGTLYTYSTANWGQLTSKVLQRDIFGFSPLVHR